jgi:hypothetical protein
MIPDNISTGTSVALHCGGYPSAIDAMKGNRYLDPELDSWGSVKATVRMNVGEINPHVRRPGCLMAVRFALPSPTGPPRRGDPSPERYPNRRWSRVPPKRLVTECRCCRGLSLFETVEQAPTQTPATPPKVVETHPREVAGHLTSTSLRGCCHLVLDPARNRQVLMSSALQSGG